MTQRLCEWERAFLDNLVAKAENHPPGEAWNALIAHLDLFDRGVVDRLVLRRRRGEDFWDALRAEGWEP